MELKLRRNKIMANKTVHNFTIKLREDRVYDLYLNGKWMVSRGSYENILTELKTIMEENV
jgi:hypothetical protein